MAGPRRILIVANFAALYVIWGGGNDLFDDFSTTSVTSTANRVGGLIMRLAMCASPEVVT